MQMFSKLHLPFILSLVLAFCLVPASASPLLRGIEGEPGVLDPAKATLNLEIEILNDLFVGLYQVGPDGNPLPGCALSWQQSKDGKTVTFEIRKGLKWSDGTQLTAEDFVYSIRRAYDPKTGAMTSDYIRIRNGMAVTAGKLPLEALGVRTEGAHKLVVEFETPIFDPARKFVASQFYPVPRHVVEKHGSSWSKAGTMVSNGPYVLRSWRKGAELRLEKNPFFVQAANVKLDRVTYVFVPDLAALSKRVRAGELHTASNFLASEVDLLKRSLPAGVVRITPSRYVFYLQPNFKKDLLRNPDIRRAISLAIDRELIASRILKIGQPANYSMTPPGIPAYSQARLDYAGWERVRRRDEASRLMEKAGFGPAKPLKIPFSFISLQNQKQVAIAIAAMLKPIGIELEMQAQDAATHFASMDIYDFTLAAASWSEGPDPEYFVYLMNSKSKPYNAGYENPVFDRKFAEATAAVDPAKRMELFRQAEQIALNDHAVIPLYVEVNRALVSPRVQGWIDNVSGSHPSRWLSLLKD